MQGKNRIHKIGMVLLTAMVFLAAILLFWMEPLVGRMLTPYFGGAANVWLLCLMFFQAMLFLGYLYALSPGEKSRTLSFAFSFAAVHQFAPEPPGRIQYPSPFMECTFNTVEKCCLAVLVAFHDGCHCAILAFQLPDRQVL